MSNILGAHQKRKNFYLSFVYIIEFLAKKATKKLPYFYGSLSSLLSGGPTWIRTRDQPVMSRGLYR